MNITIKINRFKKKFKTANKSNLKNNNYRLLLILFNIIGVKYYFLNKYLYTLKIF